MFIEPESEINIRRSTWKNHSVNECLILQSREPPKQKSFLQSLGVRLHSDLELSKDRCATLSTENCKYRILTKALETHGSYIIAIDNSFRSIITDWNRAGEAIIPEVSCDCFRRYSEVLISPE